MKRLANKYIVFLLLLGPAARRGPSLKFAFFFLSLFWRCRKSALLRTLIGPRAVCRSRAFDVVRTVLFECEWRNMKWCFRSVQPQVDSDKFRNVLRQKFDNQKKAWDERWELERHITTCLLQEQSAFLVFELFQNCAVYFDDANVNCSWMTTVHLAVNKMLRFRHQQLRPTYRDEFE